MGNLIVIISIITGIFQIILFFKIWRMTEDVKALKQKGDFKDKAKIAFLLGNKENAKLLLDEAFFTELITFKNTYGEGVNSELYTNTIKSLKDKYSKLYIKMDLSTPDFDKFNDPKMIP